MLSITELKKGTLIEIESVPYRVVEYNQKQLGRGGSIVNTKLKNLVDGSVVAKTFKGADKIAPALVGSKSLQYLYSDEQYFYFMDQDSFEQFSIEQELVGNNHLYMKEGSSVSVQIFDDKIIGVELPIKVNLEVTSAPEVVKGDTQSTVLKDVVLETGTTIQAPIFIKAGDTIVVDTRNGSYVERAK